MTTNSTSNIVITNKTAFPLNIALTGISPLQHANSVEPGDSWITYPPSHFSLPPGNMAGRVFSYIFSHVPAVPSSLFLSNRRSHPLCMKFTTIEVRFDHEHNRFSPLTAFHLWMSFVLRYLGLFSLISAFTLFLTAQLVHHARTCAYPKVDAVTVPAGSWVLAVLGVASLAYSYYELHKASSGSDPDESQGLILSIPVPTHTLHPPPSNHSTPHAAGYGFGPGPTALPRTHRHLTVSWVCGRFALWDVDRDQEITKITGPQ